jgi:hypothetical protein
LNGADVEDTLAIVKMLAEKNELARREEFILAGGYRLSSQITFSLNLQTYNGQFGCLFDLN